MRHPGGVYRHSLAVLPDDGETLRKRNFPNPSPIQVNHPPKNNDFSRLDERFRLPPGTWDHIPQYKNFGFAVFKLKKDQRTIHPIAFEFPRVDRMQLFFPTVHIHDGKVHDEAEFDHTLYAQFRMGHEVLKLDWTESRQPAGLFMSVNKCEGLVLKHEHVYKTIIKGNHKNEDIVV